MFGVVDGSCQYFYTRELLIHGGGFNIEQSWRGRANDDDFVGEFVLRALFVFTRHIGKYITKRGVRVSKRLAAPVDEHVFRNFLRIGTAKFSDNFGQTWQVPTKFIMQHAIFAHNAVVIGVHIVRAQSASLKRAFKIRQYGRNSSVFIGLWRCS